MGFTVFRSDVVPPEDRFELCRALVGGGAVPTRFTSDRTDDFPVAAANAKLGTAHLVKMSFPPVRMVRTAALIRRSDPEHYQLMFVRSGEVRVSQAGNESTVRAGELALWNTSHPYEAHTPGDAAGNAARVALLHLPIVEVPLPGVDLDRIVARVIPARRGVGDGAAAIPVQPDSGSAVAGRARGAAARPHDG